jgi:hypothetical protein
MVCFRGLWLLSLAFTVASSSVRAQQPAAGAPPQRTVTFRFDERMETEVAEIYAAPGSSTTVHMPAPVRKDGYAIKGGQGRITVVQPPGLSNILMVLATGSVGTERVSLVVTTVDGKRYPFSVATLPGLMDSQVRVVSWKEGEEDRRLSGGPSIMEVLVQDKEIAVRSFEQSKRDRSVPWVEKAVRQDNLLYLRVYRHRNEEGRPWKVQTAVLVGHQGERWKVVGVRWGKTVDRDSNVIVAELPEGWSEERSLESIQLRGDDGVDIQLDGKGVLP